MIVARPECPDVPVRLHESDGITVYWGDGRAVMADLADGSVDAVITDPPFSERTHAMARSHHTHAPAGGRALSGSKAKFGPMDDVAVDALFHDLGALARGWVVSSLDYRHAVSLEAEPPPTLRVLRIGTWIKTNPMPMLSGDRPAQGWEAFVCCWAGDGKPRWNGGGSAINHVGPTAQGTGHPTSKPLAMVRRWVEAFTNPGDLVLDPYGGSGTTARACLDLGRRCITVEERRAYCDIIIGRLGHTPDDAEDVGALF